MKEFKGKSFDDILLKAAKPMSEKLLNAEIDKHQVNSTKNARNGYSQKNS